MLIQRGPNPQAWDSAQRAAAAAGCPELECWAARTRSSTKSSAVSSCRHTALQHRLLTAAWLRTPPSQLCRVRHQTSPPSPLARAAAQLTTRSDPPAKLSEQGSCLCGRGACAGFARYNPRPFSRQIQRPSGEEWRGVERTGEEWRGWWGVGAGARGASPAPPDHHPALPPPPCAPPAPPACSPTPPPRLRRQREFCHSADIPSSSLLKHLLKGEGVAAE